MATAAEMHTFRSKLQTSDSFKWLVPGLSVVAIFSSAHGPSRAIQHLGQPTWHNQQSDSLLLWIGLDPENSQLLVTLTLRLKVGGRARKTKAQREGQLMFLVVPTEELSLGYTYHAFGNLFKDDVLRPLLDVPSDIGSRGCKLSDIAFDIGGTKNYVIMNQSGQKTLLSAQPMSLIRRFKALAETSKFRLFANHDAATEASLERIQIMLQGARAVIVPQIELKAFYPGRRQAGIDLWEAHGWRPEEHEVSGQEYSTDNKPFAGNAQDDTSDNCPPPYVSPLPPAYIRSPSNSPSVIPCSSPPLPAASHAATRQRNATLVSQSPTVIPDSLPEYKPMFSSISPAPPPPPEPSVSSNYTGDLLSTISEPQSALASVHNNILTPSRSLLGSTRRSVSRHDDSQPSDRPHKKRPLYSIDDDNGIRTIATSARQSEYAQHRQCQDVLVYIHNAGIALSPTVVDESSVNNDVSLPSSQREPSCPTEPSQFQTLVKTSRSSPDATRHDCMSQWLVHAWELYPDAHYTFIVELLRLGVAANSNDADAFHDSHVACTIALVRHCPKEQYPNPPAIGGSGTHADSTTTSQIARVTVSEENLRDSLPVLTSWLYILDPQSTVSFLPDLLRLSKLERSVSRSLGHNERDRYDELLDQYTRQKAHIVTVACMRLGENVLKQRERDILSEMVREQARRGI